MEFLPLAVVVALLLLFGVRLVRTRPEDSPARLERQRQKQRRWLIDNWSELVPNLRRDGWSDERIAELRRRIVADDPVTK